MASQRLLHQVTANRYKLVGGPQDVVQLEFTHDRNGTYTNTFVIDTFPPWLPRSGEKTR